MSDSEDAMEMEMALLSALCRCSLGTISSWSHHDNQDSVKITRSSGLCLIVYDLPAHVSIAPCVSLDDAEIIQGFIRDDTLA